MTLLAGAAWSPTDDDGTGNTGTAVNAAWVAAIKASIEAAIHSAANPTVDPNEITDEVVTARGASLTLDARITALESSVGGVPTPGAILAGVGKANLMMDELFLIWAAGDAAAPTCYTLTGAGGTVARCGTALADTNSKIGDFCARIRRVAADTTLAQNVISGPAILRAPAAFRGKVAGIGAWVRSTSIAGARLYIDDGVGTTYSTANAAANTWEWLSLQRTLNAASTSITVGIINDVNAADAYISGPTFFLGDIGDAPVEWVPSPTMLETVQFFIPGNQALAAPKIVWASHRPGIVKDVVLTIATPPTGASIKVDVNSWDGVAYTSMYTAGTRPEIAIAGAYGGSQPTSGTYARRCLAQQYGNESGAGTRLSVDIDQIGSGTVGADMTVSIRILVPARFYESVLDYNFA